MNKWRLLTEEACKFDKQCPWEIICKLLHRENKTKNHSTIATIDIGGFEFVSLSGFTGHIPRVVIFGSEEFHIV